MKPTMFKFETDLGEFTLALHVGNEPTAALMERRKGQTKFQPVSNFGLTNLPVTARIIHTRCEGFAPDARQMEPYITMLRALSGRT